MAAEDPQLSCIQQMMSQLVARMGRQTYVPVPVDQAEVAAGWRVSVVDTTEQDHGHNNH
jgi:hypothetical protein